VLIQGFKKAPLLIIEAGMLSFTHANTNFFVLYSCDVQIPAALNHYSTLTKEQKEKIADGPGLDDFISESAEEIPTPTAPLKSKAGERYFSDIMFDNFVHCKSA
jgi:hypothetical protein